MDVKRTGLTAGERQYLQAVIDGYWGRGTPLAMLNDEEVRTMLRAHSASEVCRNLAKKMGVTI